MRSEIVTVAGLSSRFNRDTKVDVLKCLYHEGGTANSLLVQQVLKTKDLVDEIIIVGGFKFDDLVAFVQRELADVQSKIKLVYNEHYHDFGSGYSLLKGIEAVSEGADEIVFVEGDLFFDTNSIKTIICSKKDVVSVNNEPILSNKSVALYFDANNYPHYIYDTDHSCLVIPEPFTAIYNSGQMWKFGNLKKLRIVCEGLSQQQKEGTNLVIVQGYFGDINARNLEIVTVDQWFNCNTVNDYREAIKNFIK